MTQTSIHVQKKHRLQAIDKVIRKTSPEFCVLIHLTLECHSFERGREFLALQ